MSRSLLGCSFILFAALYPATAKPAASNRDSFTLSNHAISATWSLRGGSLRWQSLTNHYTGAQLSLDESVFVLLPKEGPALHSADFKILEAPVQRDIPPALTSAKAADRLPGREVRIELEDSSAHIRVLWKAILREDANYIRQEITVRALNQPLALAEIALIDAVVPGGAVSGNVKGSPVTAGTWFFGFEHPLSDCRVRADRATCWLSRELPLQAGQSVYLLICCWGGPSHAIAPRLSALCGTRTRSSLPHVPALQLLV